MRAPRITSQRTRRVACDLPGCKGGVRHGTEWSDACHVCKGRGSYSYRWLARLLGVSTTTLLRLARPGARVRPQTAARILDEIVTLQRQAARLSEMRGAA